MESEAKNTAAIYKLLDDNTTQTYYMEHGGFMTNHISQALYSLAYLKAPSDHVQKFLSWMKMEKLEAAEDHGKNYAKTGKYPENVDEVLGTQTHFYYIYDHYQNLLVTKYNGSIAKMIDGELPRLCGGLIAAATHGLIHIGYGYAAKRDWFVCEGFAYLHHSYLPLQPSRKVPVLETLGCGTTNIINVLNLIREDRELTDVLAELKKKENVEGSGFSSKARALFKTKSDEFIKYVHMIQFPTGLNAKDLTLDKIPLVANWIVDCAIIVYAIAEVPNDFFLLHGVTSAWSFKQILPLFTKMEDVLHAVQSYLATLFSVYVIQHYPSLNTELLKHNEGLSYDWQDLIDKAVYHTVRQREHQFKLVQVCKMMSDETQNEDMEPIYRLACHLCVTEPYTFVFEDGPQRE